MLAFEVLPKLQREVRSGELASVVAEHLEETREHATRLEQVFRVAGAEPSSNLSPPFEQLASHHDELAAGIPDDRLADSYHAASAAATEHLELALYDSVVVFARTLELRDAVGLLERNRNEDAAALDRLRAELDRIAGEFVVARSR
jgi:ferritin-like metal-binding protein YciE